MTMAPTKREAILSATLELVVDEGLPAFSFSKLFAKAGAGSGTVYNYFPSKRALLEALFDEVSSRLDEAVLRHWGATASLRVQFDALLRGLARFTMERPKDVAFIEACSHSKTVQVAVRERVTPGQSRLMQVIAEGQRAGLLRPMDPHLAMAIATSQVVATVGAGLTGKYRFGDEELELVLDAAWRALATPRGLRARLAISAASPGGP